MRDLDQKSKPDSETTPYDQAWSFAGSSLIVVAVVVFLVLTFGSPNLFGSGNKGFVDGQIVNQAYFGALILSVGMTAQACIGLCSLCAFTGKTRLPWPRYRRLEDDKGLRPTPLAIISLAGIVLIPLVVMRTSLDKYLGKSEISCWDAKEPLASGFWASRKEALSKPCPDSVPCFRMHHQDGIEWFAMSDIALLVFVVAAVIVWIVFILAILRHMDTFCISTMIFRTRRRP